MVFQAFQFTMARCDRDRLMQDIRSGILLRPTKTNDRSKPIILVEGEQLKKVQVGECIGAGGPPPPPPPPPPLPPPAPSFGQGTFSKLKTPTTVTNQTGPADRDALLRAIRQGVTLRKVGDTGGQEIKGERGEGRLGEQGKVNVAEKPDNKGPLAWRSQSPSDGPEYGNGSEASPIAVHSSTTLSNGRNVASKAASFEISDFPPKSIGIQKRPATSPIAIHPSTSTNVRNSTVRANPVWESSPSPPRRDVHVRKYSAPTFVSEIRNQFDHNPIKPQKSPASPVKKAPSIQSDSIKRSSPPTSVSPKSDFVLNGFVSGAKAVWEKRSSNEEPIQQPVSIRKGSTGPAVLRFFNGPDYPNLGPVTPPPLAPPAPIQVDTNFPCSSDLNGRKSVTSRDSDERQSKVDDLRRTYEKVETKRNCQLSNTLRRYQQRSTDSTRPMATRSRSYDSLDNEDCQDCSNSSIAPSVKSAPQTKKETARFLPDVSALKRRFEMNLNHSIKPYSNGQHQQTSSTSNISSGYSSGSPSPKSNETYRPTPTNRFQFNTAHSTIVANGSRMYRSGNHMDCEQSIQSRTMGYEKSMDKVKNGIIKGYNGSDSLEKATRINSGSNVEETTVKKTRNYYQSKDHHQNGNANETATWIVKKGNVPNIVAKYSVCEHLENLHQRKFTKNITRMEDSENNIEKGVGIKCNEEMDGEVARLLGIPYEKLKDMRFDIDVNDPEGSLLRIQQRYNEMN